MNFGGFFWILWIFGSFECFLGFGYFLDFGDFWSFVVFCISAAFWIFRYFRVSLWVFCVKGLVFGVGIRRTFVVFWIFGLLFCVLFVGLFCEFCLGARLFWFWVCFVLLCVWISLFRMLDVCVCVVFDCFALVLLLVDILDVLVVVWLGV